MNSEISIEEENELIGAIVAGNAGKFDVLVQNHQHRVFASMLAMLGNRHDAEDVTQDAFFTAYRKLEKFEYRSSFYTWIHRIAFNLAIDLQRRRASRCASQHGDLDVIEANASDREPSPTAAMVAEETSVQVQMALSRLDAERRNLITLRDIQGMDYAQIAELLEIPIGTVRSRLHRARMELRDIMLRIGLVPDHEPEPPSAQRSESTVTEHSLQLLDRNVASHWSADQAIEKKGRV